MVNFKLLAVKIGDELKYDTSINEIDRIADAIFDFECLEFHKDNITSERAKLIYDWVMSLGEQEMSEEAKLSLLKEFVDELAPEDNPARDLFDKKPTDRECINLLQELEKSIASIKEAIMFLVLIELSEGEDKYIQSYSSIKNLINKLNNECGMNLVHLNPHETESSIIAYISYEKITEHNIGDYLNNWYDPLEKAIWEKYPIKKINEPRRKSTEDIKQQVIQHFHGNVGNLALGNINTYNTNIYLNALIKAIEESNEIPEEDKRSLIDKIKNIAQNQYVAGIGAGLIVEAIKSLPLGK